MAAEVGHAYVSLLPSARGFSKLAQRELRRELRDGVPIKVTPEIDQKAFEQGLPSQPLRLPVELDPLTAAFGRELARQTAALSRSTGVSVPVRGDTAGLREDVDRGVADVRRDLVAVQDTVRLRVRTDVEVDRESIGRSTRQAEGQATQAGGALGRLFTSGFGSTIANPLIGIPALVAAVFLAPFLAGVTAAAVLAGGALGVIFAGAFLQRANPELQAAGTRFIERVTRVFTEASAPLVGPFIAGLERIGQAFEDLAPSIRAAFKAVAPMIDVLVGGLGPDGNSPSGIVGFLHQFIPTFAEALPHAMPAIEALAERLPDIGNALGQFFMSMALVAPDAAQAFSMALGIVAATIRWTGDAIVWLVGKIETVGSIIFGFFDLVSAVFGFIRDGFRVIKDAITGDGIELAGAFNLLLHGIGAAWNGFWNGFVGPVLRGIETVLGIFRNAPNQMLAALGNVGSLLYNAGKAIVEGLINGIRSMGANLRDAASWLAQTVRNFLPFSPAKEGPFSGRGAPIYSGQAIARDFAAGMTNGLPTVRTAADQLAGSAAVGAAASASGTGRVQAEWVGDAGDPVMRALQEHVRIYYGGSAQAAFGTT